MLLVVKSKLISSRVHVFDHADVAVHLDVRRASVPLAFYGLFGWGNLMELRGHVLLFGDTMYGLVVHEDLEPFLVDADSAGHLCRFNIYLHRYSRNERFHGSFHQVHSPEVIIAGHFTSNSGLDEEASDYEVTVSNLSH